MPEIIVYAVPAFIILIIAESILCHRQGKPYYTFKDTLNNMSSGMIEQCFTAVAKVILIAGYVYLYQHHRIATLDSSSLWVIVLTVFGVDFCYYWMHRCAHRCSILWCGHSVHHQSQRYNLSVALRQGIIQAWYSWIFYLPLALLGVSPWLMVTVYSFNLLYQFWIHTQLIDKMGFAEHFMNTPSHHRVHHGTNPNYLDKNYAGMFIIWDKLFGTFEPESEPVNYGLTEPLENWNPLLANVKVLEDVKRRFPYIQRWQRALAFFKPPEWVAHQANTTIKPSQRINQTPLSLKGKVWSLINYSIASAAFLYLMLNLDLTLLQQIGLVTIVLINVIIIGNRFDRQ